MPAFPSASRDLAMLASLAFGLALALQTQVEHARAGKLKIIGTLGATPSALMPNVSLASTAARRYDFSGSFGLVARAGTPPALVHRIRDDIAAVMQLPQVATYIREIGQEPIISTPEEHNAYIQSEMREYVPIVRPIGLKVD